MLLALHYYPSAQKFAEALQSGKSIVYHGNPLDDMTMIRFLDRFVYKNPKKLESSHKSALERKSRSRKLQEIPVNSDIFLHKDVESVATDDVSICLNHLFCRAL